MKNLLSSAVLLIAIGTTPRITIASEGDIEIKPVKVVDPKVERRAVREAAIDAGMFEVGLYSGFLTVEDFNSNPLIGISGNYHISERWLIQLNYARSDVEKSTYEEVIDGSFLKSDDRQFEYFELSGAYNVFPGRSFFTKKSKYNSGLYFLAGVGNSSFAGDDNFTLVLGSSYRVVISDWLTCNLDLRDHIVERKFLDDDKFTHNIELSLGLNILF